MFCVLVAFFASSHDLFGRHDDGFFDRDRGKIKRYRSPQVFTKELHIIYLHIYSIVVPTAPPKKDTYLYTVVSMRHPNAQHAMP